MLKIGSVVLGILAVSFVACAAPIPVAQERAPAASEREEEVVSKNSDSDSDSNEKANESRPRIDQGAPQEGAAASIQVTSVSPSSATRGQSSITLSVQGSGFMSTSEIVFNGTRLVTASFTTTSITAMVPSKLLQSAGNVSIVVTDSTNGKTSTGSLTFSIHGSNDIGGGGEEDEDAFCDGGLTCSDLGLAPNQCVIYQGRVVQCDAFDGCLYHGCL